MVKKISLVLVLLLLASPLILAQTEEEEAGITPDSPLWGIDVAVEKVMMMFTFRQENKVNFGLQIANERLAEIQMMVQQNKLQFINKAEIRRTEIVDEVEVNMANGLSEEHREFVSERLQKHINRLEGVKEGAPELAQERLQNAIEKSSKNLERIKIRQI